MFHFVLAYYFQLIANN